MLGHVSGGVTSTDRSSLATTGRSSKISLDRMAFHIIQVELPHILLIIRDFILHSLFCVDLGHTFQDLSYIGKIAVVCVQYLTALSRHQHHTFAGTKSTTTPAMPVLNRSRAAEVYLILTEVVSQSKY